MKFFVWELNHLSYRKFVLHTHGKISKLLFLNQFLFAVCCDTCLKFENLTSLKCWSVILIIYVVTSIGVNYVTIVTQTCVYCSIFCVHFQNKWNHKIPNFRQFSNKPSMSSSAKNVTWWEQFIFISWVECSLKWHVLLVLDTRNNRSLLFCKTWPPLIICDFQQHNNIVSKHTQVYHSFLLMFIVDNGYYSKKSFKLMRYQYYSIDDIMKWCWKMVFLREKKNLIFHMYCNFDTLPS